MSLPAIRCIARLVALSSMLFTPAIFADDPPQLGTCGASQHVGDTCATGICAAGEQTIYRCDADMKCMKSDDKQTCAIKKVPPQKKPTN